MAKVGVSTFLDTDIADLWNKLCQKNGKTSYQMLRDVVMLVLNKKQFDDVFPKGS